MKRSTPWFLIFIAQIFSISISAQDAQTVEAKRDKPELVIQTGHSDEVFSVAFSPDGKTIASGSKDSTIKLWNVHTGQQIRTLEGDSGVVAFSPSGKTLASVSSSNIIKLWDIETGQQIKSFKGYIDSVGSIAFSLDGKTLVSVGGGNIIRFIIELWDVETGQQIKSLEGHTRPVRSVAFSPDGKTLASGSQDKTVKLWNVETGQQIKSLEGHTEWVESVTFSPDGKTIASGSRDKTIILWNVETGQQIKSLEGHIYPVNSVAFSPDGKTLVSASNDSTIKLWNAETGQLIKSLVDHNNLVHSVAFSPDGKTLATGGWDSLIKLWNAETGQQIKSFNGYTSRVYSVAFSPDGKMLASGGNDKTIKLWNIESGEQLKSLEGHTEWVNSVAFSPDGKTLASGSQDKTIKLWNVETGQQVNSLEGDPYYVKSVIFSPDGKTLASGGGDKTIKLWNAKTGKQIKSLEGHTNSVDSVTFSPDGKTLASGSDDFTIKLWNVETGQQAKVFVGHTFFVYSVAFSPDGKIIASGSHDKTIKLWNVESGQQIKSLHGHTSSVFSVAFSHDGKTLASGGWDSLILWNVETGQQIKSLKGHTYSIESVIFSPDGKTLASGSRDITIKLWNVESESLLSTLISLDKDKWVVTTPDGRFDTNEDLNKIEGLIWILPDQPLTPKPLEIFTRQYYEPGLLPRILRCTEEKKCDKEFKPLPSIAEINRVQPQVEIKKIKSKANNAELVDVVVEVESRSEEIAQKQLASGVYDLRLFRDGQLVAASTPPDQIAIYNEKSIGVSDNEETAAWREANNLANLNDVKFDSNGKAAFTFHNVKLPRNGEKQTELSVYAFNADRVKSNTDRKTFNLPVGLSSTTRKGRAFLVTIGVNASDNPAYNLLFAANDARKMQDVVGQRLRQSGKYTEVIQVPLISDNQPGKETNTARKQIIKGVFSLLAGHRNEAEEVIKLIPNAEQIKAVEPEDTLIIAFSGHGYADRNGIFYMLPADLPEDSKPLTAAVLKRTISSDELSLWMRDITAKEMLMIVDACHSAAAVQGKDFKPGPMGSRGLGQLAYDKGMRILVATQADNVALEFNELQQGLLSYALVQDGIVDKKADTEKEFNQLTATEWLGFAVKDVPQVYDDIRTGKMRVLVDGKRLAVGQKGTDVSMDLSGSQQKTSGTNLQQPALFDFRKKKTNAALFSLP